MNSPLRPRAWLGSLSALVLLLTSPVARSAVVVPPPAPRLPPPGIAIPDLERESLTAGAAALRKAIDAAAREIAVTRPALLTLLPDVEVFHKAVDWALRYDEFFDEKQILIARQLLTEGQARAAQLQQGTAPWTTATGLVIRGYRSKVDESIQPFALVIPANWRPTDVARRRLDVVLAGRNDRRSELAFIAERQRSPGDIVPANGIVLHPYGRYCNATKYAGEADVFEALEATQQRYPIDADRIIVRGFSMGGASTWHLATHHAGLWAAASPGAGHAETAIYTGALAAGQELRPLWEQKLWRWYDSVPYAGNLFNVPTIAYSGELDPQKLSADLMEKALAAEGQKLVRLIGPKTEHAYEPATKAMLSLKLDELAAKGRQPAQEVRLTTYTLQYPTNSWVTVTALGRHWERADVIAKLERANAMTVTTKNVVGLRLTPAPDWTGRITIDQQVINVGEDQQIGATIWLVQTNGKWAPGLVSGRRKSIGLTGPINDAFMDAFVFVRPTGPALNQQLGRWTTNEITHATKMWRDVFRGEAPIKNDSAVTADDIANKNLILWGDPSSNEVIAQILGRLPLQWDAEKLVVRGEAYDAAHHAPILIFPNPLNPRRYVVLNSGIDFREEAYGTNALQTPKLPDYAVVDLRTPPNRRWPGKIVDAGFFDEEWK